MAQQTHPGRDDVKRLAVGLALGMRSNGDRRGCRRPVARQRFHFVEEQVFLLRVSLLALRRVQSVALS